MPSHISSGPPERSIPARDRRRFVPSDRSQPTRFWLRWRVSAADRSRAAVSGRGSACARTHHRNVPERGGSPRCPSRVPKARTRRQAPLRRPPKTHRACAANPMDCWWCRRLRCSSASRETGGHVCLADYDCSGVLEPLDRKGIGIGQPALELWEAPGRRQSGDVELFFYRHRQAEQRTALTASQRSVGGICGCRARSKSRTTTALIFGSSASMRLMVGIQ